MSREWNHTAYNLISSCFLLLLPFCSTEGHLGCLQFLAVTNEAIINTRVQVFVWTWVSIPLEEGVELLCEVCFVRNCHLLPRCPCPLPSCCPVDPHPRQHSSVSIFHFSHPGRWVAALICRYLIAHSHTSFYVFICHPYTLYEVSVQVFGFFFVLFCFSVKFGELFIYLM